MYLIECCSFYTRAFVLYAVSKAHIAFTCLHVYVHRCFCLNYPKIQMDEWYLNCLVTDTVTMFSILSKESKQRGFVIILDMENQTGQSIKALCRIIQVRKISNSLAMFVNGEQIHLKPKMTLDRSMDTRY